MPTIQELIDCSPVAMILFDRRGTIIAHNDHARRIVGTDLVGLTVDDLASLFVVIDEEGNPLSSDRLATNRTRATGERHLSTIGIIDTSQKTRWVTTRATPLPDGETLSAFVDVTDVYEARWLAQSLKVDHDEFIASVSHELRTPLSLILGYAELATDTERPPDPAEMSGWWRIVLKNARAMHWLVGNIVTAFKVTSNHLTPNVPTDFAEVVYHTVESMQVLAERQKIYLRVDLEPVIVCGNDVELNLMLNNLLQNAIKFTHIGGVTVSLTQSNGCARLEITDTGIGIPHHAKERIFDLFYQVDGSDRRRYGGTGIGLHVVRLIVEKHNGVITVNSELGVGSSFVVTFPPCNVTR